MPLLVAACGQNGSDNMMAPNATTLSPAQIDLALGPEPVDSGDNQAAPANEVIAPQAVQPANAAGASVPDSAPDESAEEEPAVEDEAELPPDGNNSTEE